MTTTTNPVGVTRRRVAVPNNFERRAFAFMRLSGAALLILAVGHMMIQHVFNTSANLTIQFVAERWNSWGWKLYDLLLLAFAIPHGFNGLRNVLADYVHKDSTMKLISILLVIATIVTIIWAGVGLIAFDPTAVN